MEPDATDAQAVGGAPLGRGGRAKRFAASHPLLVVAAGATAVGIGHAVWIWTHRRLGALDPDESGYIATALRYQRVLDPMHPFAFISAVGGTGTAPLVPLMSVPLLIIGPRDPRTVMMIQPLLTVFTSVALAGIARRLAGPWTAIASGLAYLALPTVILATQSYWYGLGAAAAIAGAMWALLASERASNRWVYAYGFGVGCMLLARTMTLAFVPAVVLAGLIVAGWDRRKLFAIARALTVAVLVAAPWYFVARDAVFGYLVSYGYGPRAGLFGQGGVPERIGFRIHRLLDGIGGGPFVFTVGVAALTGAIEAWRRGRRPGWPESTRNLIAVAIAVTAGTAALVSTTNNGVWFELPIVALCVPLGATLVARSPWTARGLLAVLFGGMGALQLAVAWWFVPPTTIGPWFARSYLTGTHFEAGFAQYDDRFATENREYQFDAAEEWRSLATDVQGAMRDITPDGTRAVFTMSGNMQPFNSNTLQLVAELDGWPGEIRIPDTTRTSRRRAEDLTPAVIRGNGDFVERVLVVALHDRILFTPDRDVADFTEQAQGAGWEVTGRFDIPRGGEVLMLRHPDRGPRPPDRNAGQANG